MVKITEIIYEDCEMEMIDISLDKEHEFYMSQNESDYFLTHNSDYPDIDIDFEHNDRVKEDLINEFGDDVALVSNYNTFRQAGLLKDLGRTYSLESAAYFSALNKKIKLELEQSLEIFDEDEFSETNFDDLIKGSTSLKDFLEANPVIEKDMRNLLGKIKHIGKHAAGVIISDNLIKNQSIIKIKGNLQTSLNEGAQSRLLSDFGFVKIDILGLKTLKVLHNCLEYVSEKKSKSSMELYNDLIHPDKLDLEDRNVYKKIFDEFNLKGIFQFETNSMRQMIEKTKPDSFKDLVAINALFRPGPLSSGIAFEYGDRKRGTIKSDFYNNDIAKEVLTETYGVLAYQEQVMLLGNKLGKFSMDETNALRKMLMKTKKGELKDNPKLIEAEERFKKGALENKMEQEDIDRIWQDMVSFSKYAFNKCLTGDTVLLRGRTNQYCKKEVTIKELFEEQSKDTEWGKKIRKFGFPQIQALFDDYKVRPHDIKEICENGIKKVYEVETKLGFKIKSTDNHRFLTPEKYKMVKELNEGDDIFVYNDEYSKNDYKKTGQKWKLNISKGLIGFQNGDKNPAFVDGSSIEFNKSKEKISVRSGGKCECCGKEKSKRFEYHHKEFLDYFDFDRIKYNSEDNIIFVCNSCHKKLHYEKGRTKSWQKGKNIQEDKIKSIKYIGKEMTYDIEMDNPFHNFIANGFVSHNSHSVGYAMIAYQCSYLKTYYPLEFYCALLEAEDAENYEKIIKEINENGFEVKEFDINKSKENFSIIDGKIYFGYRNITGFGEKAVEQLLISRNNKKFSGLADFLLREDILWRPVNKKIINILIKIGAFDFREPKRDLLLRFYEKYNDRKNHLPKKFDKWTREEKSKAMKNLYIKTMQEEEFLETADEQKMIWELEYYKFNLLYSPFKLKKNDITIKKILKSGKVGGFSGNKKFFLVIFTEIKRFKDKNGREMCFVDMIDHEGKSKNGVIFSSRYVASKLRKSELYFISGKNDGKMIVNSYESVKNF